MPRKLTQKEFIEKAKLIHGNLYDYSLVEYVNSITKIKIICSNHGIFEQIPSSHLMGTGCGKCKGSLIDKNDFLMRLPNSHILLYDYSKVEYFNSQTKIEIVCKKHGSFWQRPNRHQQGDGCPKCAGVKLLTQTEFIDKANKIHNYKYDYSKVEYIKSSKNIEIICPSHDSFWQLANTHLQGSGCPICKQSKGEHSIRIWLEENNINFIQQYKFNDCLNPITNKILFFDFYLPNQNICIEYDGIQHFVPSSWGKDKSKDVKQKNLLEIQQRDKIKNQYCLDYGIKLIRIPYLFFSNIQSILEEKINAKSRSHN